MYALGDSLQRHLAGREVEHVVWQTDGSPVGWHYLLRGYGAGTVTREIWPWLMQDAGARPTLEVVTDDLLLLRVAGRPGSRTVAIALSESYDLRLLASEGVMLVPAPSP